MKGFSDHCGIKVLTGDAALLKTLTFARVPISVAFTGVYLLTGSARAGGLVALVEPACNPVAYHFHEKIGAAVRRRQSWTPVYAGCP